MGESIVKVLNACFDKDLLEILVHPPAEECRNPTVGYYNHDLSDEYENGIILTQTQNAPYKSKTEIPYSDIEEVINFRTRDLWTRK